mmetsp:Transcript_28870/g.40837  ORF Transcript_28870/g.40837 Transcript_28870/m.40837 type:complete len:100 (+) Transcript_28870:690-989(+)
MGNEVNRQNVPAETAHNQKKRNNQKRKSKLKKNNKVARRRSGSRPRRPITQLHNESPRNDFAKAFAGVGVLASEAARKLDKARAPAAASEAQKDSLLCV